MSKKSLYIDDPGEFLLLCIGCSRDNLNIPVICSIKFFVPMHKKICKNYRAVLLIVHVWLCGVFVIWMKEQKSQHIDKSFCVFWYQFCMIASIQDHYKPIMFWSYVFICTAFVSILYSLLAIKISMTLSWTLNGLVSDSVNEIIKGSLMMHLVRVSLWPYWLHMGEMEKRFQGMDVWFILNVTTISSCNLFQTNVPMLFYQV